MINNSPETNLIQSAKLLRVSTSAAKQECADQFKIVAAFTFGDKIHAKGFNNTDEVKSFFKNKGITRGEYVALVCPQDDVIYMV